MCVLNKVENARVKGNTCAYAWWCVYLVPFQCLPFVSVVCRYVVCGRPVARIRSSTHHIFISIQKTKTDAKPKTKKIRAREKTSRISIAVFPPKKTNRRFTNLEITQGVRISEYTCIWVNSVFTTWKQTKKSSDDVRFGSVRFGSVVSGALARATGCAFTDSLFENGSSRGNARTRRTMAKKAAKERMDKGRDELVNMATVSKPTTLVRPRYEHE